MRKKRIWLLAVAGILVLALAAPAAFGAIDGNDQNVHNQQNQKFIDQMLNWHQSWLDQAQKGGQITPEQAKAWQDHFNYMRDFHAQNGFGLMGSMMMGDFGGNNGFGGMMGESQTN